MSAEQEARVRKLVAIVQFDLRQLDPEEGLEELTRQIRLMEKGLEDLGNDPREIDRRWDVLRRVYGDHPLAYPGRRGAASEMGGC